MVGAREFEPPVSCSRSKRSTRLSYAPNENRVIEGKQLKVHANCKNLDCGQDLVIKMLQVMAKEHERTNSRDIAVGL